MPGQIARSRAARTRESVRGRFVRKEDQFFPYPAHGDPPPYSRAAQTSSTRRLFAGHARPPHVGAIGAGGQQPTCQHGEACDLRQCSLRTDAHGDPGCLDGQRADHVCLPVAPLRHGWKQLRRHRLGDGSHLHARRSRHRRACPHPRLGDERVRQRRPALLALGDRRVGADQHRSSVSLRRRQERRDAHRLDGDLDRHASDRLRVPVAPLRRRRQQLRGHRRSDRSHVRPLLGRRGKACPRASDRHERLRKRRPAFLELGRRGRDGRAARPESCRPACERCDAGLRIRA